MVKCYICGVGLGLFGSDYRCKDGYVCDSCYDKAGIKGLRTKLTVHELSGAIKSKSKKGSDVLPKPVTFSATATYGDFRGEIQLDQPKHKFAFDKEIKTYLYDELTSYELIIEQGATETRTRGGVGRAIVGAAIAGPAGALIGAATSSTITKSLVTAIRVEVSTTDGKTHKVNFAGPNAKIDSDSPTYRLHIDKANSLIRALDEYADYRDQQNPPTESKPEPALVTSSPSIPEQIKQYKELLDIGAITQEEFDAKKKELLSL